MLRPLKFWHLLQLTTLCMIFTLAFHIWNNWKKITGNSDPIIIHWPPTVNNISCHISDEDDALPSAEDPAFQPAPNSIFFHETSCTGGITSRQACSVESAARAHPKRQVYLLFNSPVKYKILQKSCLAMLLQYPNIKIARVHSYEYTKNTPVYTIVRGKLWKSLHPIQHAADLMRMVTLNKWGGVYLDLDILVVKSLESLPDNWIAKENVEELSTGVMAFSNVGIGKNITNKVLWDINLHYDRYSWSYNGPQAIERVLQTYCPITLKTYGYCKGISIFEPRYFYPVNYIRTHLYFKDGTINRTDEAFTHHMWYLMTRFFKVGKMSPYAQLAQKFCPSIFDMYGKRFGV